jgi:8-oxo-dGTP diphosphatase
MARTEQAIFTVLCMVSDGNGNILVEDRLDPDWPGICLPGGHVEPGESFTAAAIRETFEETGLVMEDPRLCGVKQFQTNDDARYVVFFFKASRYHGTLRSSSEGEVFWISRDSLTGHRLVPDLEEMLKVFESPDLNEFYYYKDGNDWGLKLL